MVVPADVFVGRPHRLTMGLRRLDLATWLDADPNHDQMPQRRTLLRDRRDDVYACHPEAEGHAAQVATHVATSVGKELPGQDAPLVEASLMVRDDLCVLAWSEGAWRLVAAVVCFPSRWALGDKMGADVVSIHEPVPGYQQALGGPTRKVFDALSPRWRINWTLLDDPALFQPCRPSRPAGTPDVNWFLRVERQCLVPVQDCVAFTIRTDVTALRDLSETQRDAILASVATTPQSMATYRGWSVQ